MNWKHLSIPNGETTLFCNAYISGKDAMNIIVTHTPIVSTVDLQQAYEPLTAYGVNIFAFDFSGTGKSGGQEKDFSRDSIVKDLDAIVDYIEANYSDNIHLYGNTGIGGMLAQYYVCTGTNRIKSFAQFNCVDYKNTAGVGFAYPVVKVMNTLLKYLPNFHITLKPPSYNGYNADKDNAVYEKLFESNPDVFKSSTKMLNTVFDCFIAPDSAIKKGVSIPTLVFKTLHDRYMAPAYFDSYFEKLTCEKKCVEINDVHNSYYLDADVFCEEVYQWFVAHQ